MKELVENIISPINGLETAIVSNAEFIVGASYGKPRRGHPEGKVIYHIQEVLENIQKWYGGDKDYENLRIIAILHDTFKHSVDQTKPKVGENHHGRIARNFAKKFTIKPNVLSIIETHDDAYNAWSVGARRGDWYKAESRANNLIRFLMIEGCLDLYVKFYRCDNATGDKSQENYDWFVNLIR